MSAYSIISWEMCVKSSNHFRFDYFSFISKFETIIWYTRFLNCSVFLVDSIIYYLSHKLRFTSDLLWPPYLKSSPFPVRFSSCVFLGTCRTCIYYCLPVILSVPASWKPHLDRDRLVLLSAKAVPLHWMWPLKRRASLLWLNFLVEHWVVGRGR